MERFIKQLKDDTYEIKYVDGYVKIYTVNNKMYAECQNSSKDIDKVLFSFENADDLQGKCETILGYEIRFCERCGKPMNKGYSDDYADFYNCEECFPIDMDERYGKGNWRKYEDEYDECNALGGYYEYMDNGEWHPEPSYYTEWH